MWQVALRLTSKVYAPGELMPGDQLHIMRRGVSVRRGKVLTAGAVWGEYVVLQVFTSGATDMDRSAVRAITFVQVHASSILLPHLDVPAAHTPLTFRR